MNQIREQLDSGASVESLNRAKQVLGELAAEPELFPESDFPWPTTEDGDNLFCLHRDEDGRYALYIDLINRGVSTVPHDHGASWAIVTSIEGLEKHRFYERIDGGAGTGAAELAQKGEITIADGQGVSMLVGGIHAIEAVGTERAKMLHCYGLEFAQQTTRLEYDVDNNTCEHSIAAAGIIHEFPLHPNALRQ